MSQTVNLDDVVDELTAWIEEFQSRDENGEFIRGLIFAQELVMEWYAVVVPRQESEGEGGE